MAPKKKQAVAPADEGGPAEIFTDRHAAEFEEEFDLPSGSVTHAYRIKFGDLAPYVLSDLASNPPVLNTLGNLVWPVPPVIKRSNARGGYRGNRRMGVEEFIEESEADLPRLDGPGVHRSNATAGFRNNRRTGVEEVDEEPLFVEGPGLHRSNATAGWGKDGKRLGGEPLYQNPLDSIDFGPVRRSSTDRFGRPREDRPTDYPILDFLTEQKPGTWQAREKQWADLRRRSSSPVKVTTDLRRSNGIRKKVNPRAKRPSRERRDSGNTGSPMLLDEPPEPIEAGTYTRTTPSPTNNSSTGPRRSTRSGRGSYGSSKSSPTKAGH